MITEATATKAGGTFEGDRLGGQGPIGTKIALAIRVGDERPGRQVWMMCVSTLRARSFWHP